MEWKARFACLILLFSLVFIAASPSTADAFSLGDVLKFPAKVLTSFSESIREAFSAIFKSRKDENLPEVAKSIAIVTDTPAPAPPPDTPSETGPEKIIIERIVREPVTYITTTGGITEEDLEERLQILDNKLTSKIMTVSASIPASTEDRFTAVYRTIAHTNKIDKLRNIDINSPTIVGGTISGVTISDSTLSGSFSFDSLTVDSSTLVIDADNNRVGIGTTSPYAALSVVGSVVGSSFSGTDSATSTFAGGISTLLLNVTSSSATSTFANGINISTGCFSIGGACVGGGGGSGTVNSGTTGQVAYYAGNGTALSGTSDMVVSGGNVGIGTTSPYAKFSVAGEAVFEKFTATSTTATSTIAGGLSVESTGLVYEVGSNNVGIGTDPKSRLHIAVGSSGQATPASSRGLVIEDSTSSYIQLLSPNTASNYITFGDNNSAQRAYIAYSHSSDNLLFAVAGLGTVMTLDSNANLGIGTSTPSSRLAVTQEVNTKAGGVWLAATDGDYRALYMDTTGVLSFNGGNGAILNTATLNAAGEWTNASDVSYKENIVDLSERYSLDDILSLQPRAYLMKGSEIKRIGFIAQEVESVIPEVVSGEEGSKGISYGNMVALAIQAIKDLSRRIDALQDAIEEIKNSAVSFVRELVVDRLIAKDVESENGISVKDRETGEYYCMFVSGGMIKSEAGRCYEVSIGADSEASFESEESIDSSDAAQPENIEESSPEEAAAIEADQEVSVEAESEENSAEGGEPVVVVEEVSEGELEETGTLSGQENSE